MLLRLAGDSVDLGAQAVAIVRQDKLLWVATMDKMISCYTGPSPSLISYCIPSFHHYWYLFTTFHFLFLSSSLSISLSLHLSLSLSLYLHLSYSPSFTLLYFFSRELCTFPLFREGRQSFSFSFLSLRLTKKNKYEIIISNIMRMKSKENSMIKWNIVVLDARET